ncbi:hypothetical protein QFC24_006751 [Naganishia onofrii]|uniref:Uncharacterized protein n=1 Tax=Naganishia onofrii TaxID=1851511 RepID=A0ACC2WYD4_9TREE|nr:hypothetical protein QFC24_006751 [Naganishia onofrii]
MDLSNKKHGFDGPPQPGRSSRPITGSTASISVLNYPATSSGNYGSLTATSAGDSLPSGHGANTVNHRTRTGPPEINLTLPPIATWFPEPTASQSAHEETDSVRASTRDFMPATMGSKPPTIPRNFLPHSLVSSVRPQSRHSFYSEQSVVIKKPSVAFAVLTDDLTEHVYWDVKKDEVTGDGVSAVTQVKRLWENIQKMLEGNMMETQKLYVNETDLEMLRDAFRDSPSAEYYTFQQRQKFGRWFAMLVAGSQGFYVHIPEELSTLKTYFKRTARRVAKEDEVPEKGWDDSKSAVHHIIYWIHYFMKQIWLPGGNGEEASGEPA